jgi:hypothetical protein
MKHKKLDLAQARVFKLPKPEEIPAGKIIAHNHIRPTRFPGMRGFRALPR